MEDIKPVLVNFFLKEGNKERIIMESLELPYAPVVGQTIYHLEHPIPGAKNGLQKKKYEVTRVDWSFTQLGKEDPWKELQVILKEI